jgi:hypothetical protein
MENAVAPGVNPEERAVLERAMEAVNKWTDLDRVIFFLKFQGASAAEISGELRQPPHNKQMTINAIDVRYHKLWDRLRKELDAA